MVNRKDLKQEIQQHGHTVIQINNIQQKTTKKQLSLFFVDIKMDDNNKDIYNIDSLHQNKVRATQKSIMLTKGMDIQKTSAHDIKSV